ncbi:MAG: hypothetical protein CVV25_06780 [Ignavibacteriae bacterium HGW-Ignavibacteriae-4]|jgi:hypothetical protein|nr:MAG: hypothetical protein CVV25_06780 [Ignavibacteriae bacterium HGW-Ignavibacteriae-4]
MILEGKKMSENDNGLKFDFDTKIIRYTKPVLVLIVVVYVLTTVVYIINQIICGDFTASELGDFLGGYLGTLVSIFTVILVAQTYYTQKKELVEQKNLINLQSEEIRTARTFDLLYRETDSIINHVIYYEKNVKELSKYIETMSSDIENKNLLNDSIHTVANFKDRFDEIREDLFPFIRELNRYFKRLEFICKDRKDKDNLISLSVNKLPERVLTLTKGTKEYLLDLKSNPNRHDTFDTEESLQIVALCNTINNYFYNDLMKKD